MEQDIPLPVYHHMRWKQVNAVLARNVSAIVFALERLIPDITVVGIAAYRRAGIRSPQSVLSTSNMRGLRRCLSKRTLRCTMLHKRVED
jgi:hypothetical protein